MAAPDRVYVALWESGSVANSFTSDAPFKDSVEYIRADLVAAKEAEIKECEVHHEEIENQLKTDADYWKSQYKKRRDTQTGVSARSAFEQIDVIGSERDALREQLAAKDAEIAEMRQSGKAFLRKLDQLIPAIENAFVIAALHHCPYTGETWEKELAEFRAALNGGEGENG